MTFKMKTHYKILLLLVVLFAGFLSGTWFSSRKPDGASAEASRKIDHYLCPMHPQYISDRSGDCPSCGMRLDPVYEDGSVDANNRSHVSAGTVRIGPDRQQLIGLRIGQVEMTGGESRIRILGRVAPDDRRIFRITTASDGWIVDTRPNTVGSLVRKNEILASFYSPEFLGSEQAYIYALNSLARFQSSPNETPQQIQSTKANVQQYIDRLRNQGMSDLQIDEIGRDKLLTQKIYIVAPSSGFVLLREVSPGLRFDKGVELYRIADLSKVWIVADLFGKEAELVRPGLKAVVHSSNNPDREFQAQVSNVLPQFDPATRTLKVRLEVDNPDYALRPEMFVDVNFPVEMESCLSVPADAVVDTGLRKTIFVDKGNGYFEPKLVETGWRMNGRVQIKNGLMEGERIVVSGTFLLDSESQMQLAAAGLPNDYAIDPVCGMKVDPHKAGKKKSELNGKTIYFCSDQCKTKFDKAPEMYGGHPSMLEAKQPGMHGSSMKVNMESSEKVRDTKIAKDLVCGMDVDPSTPGVFKADYKGKTYYFCSEFCKGSFQKDPGKYLTQQPKNESPQTHSFHSTMSSQP